MQINLNHSLRSLPLLMIAGLLGCALIILNPGIFWDDWIWIFQTPEVNHQVARELGVWWAGYANNFIYALKNPVLFLRLCAFFSWVIAGFAMTYAVSKILFLKPRESIELLAFFLVTHLALVRFLNSVAFYNIYIMCFWLGAALLIGFSKSKYIRYAALPFFCFSFYLNSLIVLYLVGIIFFFVFSFINPGKVFSFKNLKSSFLKTYETFKAHEKIYLHPAAREFFIRYWIFILTPFLFFIATKYAAIDATYYSGYNEIKPHLIFKSFFKSIGLFFTCIKAYFYLFNHVPIKWILMASSAVFLMSLFLPKHQGVFSWRFSLKKILFSLVFFTFAAYPYVLVGKAPNFLDFYEARNGLVAIPAVLLCIHTLMDMIVHLFGMIESLRAWLRKLLFSLLVGASIATSNLTAVNLWADWYRQLAIMNFLDSHKQTLTSANLFVFYDYLPYKINNRTIWNYEYTGYVKKIFPENSKFAISMNELSGWPKNVPLVHDVNMKKRFHIEDFSFNDKTQSVAIEVTQGNTNWDINALLSIFKADLSHTPLPKPEDFVSVKFARIHNNSEVSIAEIFKLQQAILHYREKNHNFPTNYPSIIQAGDRIPVYGFRLDYAGPLPIINDIPGIFPRYSNKPNSMLNSDLLAPRFVYLSDGNDFKLVYLGSSDAVFVKQSHPELMDPIREAYGVWTKGAANW